MTCLMDRQPPNDLRVLIIADHASAKFGGEAILPLHYFRLLRHRGIDARLVVHVRTRDELAERFPNDLARIHFMPETKLHLVLDRCGKWLPSPIKHFTAEWLSRLLSQLMARRLIRRLIRKQRIDLVHQPIPVSPKEPSVLYDLGVPVVIGPMNGGLTFPAGFGHSEGNGWTRLTYLVARRASAILNRLLPGKLKADVLVVANNRTRRALPPSAHGRVVTLVENGVDLSLWGSRDETDCENGPVRFIFSGRLVDWKGVDLLIEAFKQVAVQIPSTLELLGDGAERRDLDARVKREGLTGMVRFLGWHSQAECARLFRTADVFVLPSLFESGGAVVLEAMAVGLPVVATRWGGPTDYLDDTCGILVPPSSREQLIAGLRDAMLRLAQSPQLRRDMGRAGRRRVIDRFDWERKVDQMLRIYAEAVAGCNNSSVSSAAPAANPPTPRPAPRPAQGQTPPIWAPASGSVS